MFHYELPGSKHLGFPRLDLVFFQDGGRPFLADCGYKHSNSSERDFALIEAKPKTKYLRSLCIFILLAKYSRSIPEPCKGDFPLNDLVLNNSWLSTLGGSFGTKTQIAFFHQYFGDNCFIQCGRGTAHTEEMKAIGGGETASAKYFDSRLKLSNLRCFSVPRFAQASTPKLLEGIDLLEMAKTLERYWIKNPASKRKVKQFWNKTVQDFADGINDGRLGSTPSGISSASKASTLPGSIPHRSHVVSSSWREIGQLARSAMSQGNLAGDWYAICVAPTWLIEWKGIFLEAVTNNAANLKFAYHSPDAGRCPGVRSQWDMYFRSLTRNRVATSKFVKERLLETRKEFDQWRMEVRLEAKVNPDRVGTLQFYESMIPHPFMALLHVQSEEKRMKGQTWAAPEGTQCIIGLYSFYPDGFEDRCAIFFNGPSPELDFYYKSIIRFFQFNKPRPSTMVNQSRILSRR